MTDAGTIGHPQYARGTLEIRSSEGDVLPETKLREQRAFLANELETAYEKPTAAEYATFDHLDAKAVAGESKLNAPIFMR